jgi:predicted permease
MRIDGQVQLTSEQIRVNIASIIGVSSASGIAIHPPNSGTINMPIRLPGRESQDQQRAQFLPIMPDYFRTLQVRVIQGREFGLQDTAGSVQVAIINETLARRFWPNENSIGSLIEIDTPLLPTETPRQIVGVVGDVAQYSGQQDRPQLYLPYAQLPLIHDERLTNDLRNLTFVFRTPHPAANVTAAVAAAVNKADRTQAISRLRTMRQTAYAKPRQRVFIGVFGIFGAIAVVLAIIGIYGVMAQVVTQRTNEIGIRMAVGARAADIRRLVLRQGSVLIVAGLGVGIIGAIAVTRIIRGYLFGISSTDRPVFLAGVLLLGGIALAACYLPARRASRIDPMTALRHD